MCDWQFQRVSYNIQTLLFHNTSLCQHKETIYINFEFENCSMFYYLCFIFYYFITSYIFNIKNCHNKSTRIQTMDRSRHIISRLDITNFCGSIARSWRYLELLKGTLEKFQGTFVDFSIQFCVLSVILRSQKIFCVTELCESWAKVEFARNMVKHRSAI